MNKQDRVLEFFQENPESSFTADEVLGAVFGGEDSTIHSVRRIIQALHYQEKLTKSHGRTKRDNGSYEWKLRKIVRWI